MTVAALEELVAIPSVSGDPAHRGDIERAAAWLAARLEPLGGRVVPTGGHPLVLGEWLGAASLPVSVAAGAPGVLAVTVGGHTLT